LTWTLGSQNADTADNGERAVIGLRLVQALAEFWWQHGHAAEGRWWLQRAIELAAPDAGVKMRTPSGLLAEQVWDQSPLYPQNGVPTLPLTTGQRTLSATPLRLPESRFGTFRAR
jgi:GH15 family glucan-1,4-alpha-glucosidase